jgi:hypothetical protein
MKKSLAALVAIVAIAALGFGLFGGTASAQPDQDGLVNIVISDSFNNLITIEDVNVNVAAQLIANVCDVKVGPVAVLGRAVDRSDEGDTICTAGGNTFRLVQN